MFTCSEALFITGLQILQWKHSRIKHLLTQSISNAFIIWWNYNIGSLAICILTQLPIWSNSLFTAKTTIKISEFTGYIRWIFGKVFGRHTWLIYLNTAIENAVACVSWVLHHNNLIFYSCLFLNYSFFKLCEPKQWCAIALCLFQN